MSTEETLRPDGFRLTGDDDYAAAHRRISAMLIKYFAACHAWVAGGNKGPCPQPIDCDLYAAEAKADPTTRIRTAIAAQERVEWIDAQPPDQIENDFNHSAAYLTRNLASMLANTF